MVDIDFVKPLQGGGFGDCKIGVQVLTGTYDAGGFDAGINQEPIFQTTDKGYVVQFENGKFKLMSGGSEIGSTDVSGTKVLFIIKGGF